MSPTSTYGIRSINGSNLMVSARSSSPYYPPRAGWHSPLLNGIEAVRRRLHLRSIQMSFDLDIYKTVVGFLVPGVAVYFCWPERLGRTALLVAALLAFVFLSELGHPLGNLALGMLLSLHVTGFVQWCVPVVGTFLSRRIGFTVLTLAALICLVYLPVRDLLARVAVPLQIEDHVVIVHPIFSTKTIRTDDQIAFNIPTGTLRSEGGVYFYDNIGFHAGMALAPVLAVPGDHLSFSKTTFSVNGVRHPALPYMPESGDVVLPFKMWFIWPNLKIRAGEGFAESHISSTLMHMALVSQSQMVGRPYHRWFWHRQR